MSKDKNKTEKLVNESVSELQKFMALNNVGIRVVEVPWMTDEEVAGYAFEESYFSEEYDTTTLYFVGPKRKEFPESDGSTISLEFPGKYIEPKEAAVSYSPSVNGEDYDYCDLNLSYEQIELLLAKYNAAKA